MIGAPNSLNLNCKVRVMKEAPDSSVSEEIADIFRNYNTDSVLTRQNNLGRIAMLVRVTRYLYMKLDQTEYFNWSP